MNLIVSLRKNSAETAVLILLAGCQERRLSRVNMGEWGGGVSSKRIAANTERTGADLKYHPVALHNNTIRAQDGAASPGYRGNLL